MYLNITGKEGHEHLYLNEKISYKDPVTGKRKHTSSYIIAKMLAEAGTCIALLQEEALRGPLSENLLIVDLDPDICYTRGLGYSLRHLNEAEQKYLDFVIEQLQ